MKRINVYITEQQSEFLQEAGKGLGIKPSELLRRIIDEYRFRHRHETEPQDRNKTK